MSKSVLLVDDNRVARMMLRLVIAELRPDWTIAEAQSGEEALAWAKGKAVDVLLIDMGLPGMNGLEVAARFRASHPDAALAMVTANIQKPVREKAAALGAAFIEKPLRPETLLAFFGSLEDPRG